MKWDLAGLIRAVNDHWKTETGDASLGIIYHFTVDLGCHIRLLR